MPTIPSLQQTTKQLSKGKVSSRFVFTSDVSHRSEENIVILPAAPKRQADPQTSKSRQTGKLARQHGNITDQELSEHMPTLPSLQQTTKQLSKGKLSRTQTTARSTDFKKQTNWKARTSTWQHHRSRALQTCANNPATSTEDQAAQ